MADVEIVFDQSAIDDIVRGLAPMVAEPLDRAGLLIEGEAKRLCRVDTGRLRASIRSEEETDADGKAVYVGTDVEYGPHVELGTRNRPATPYLRPAMTAGRGAV